MSTKQFPFQCLAASSEGGLMAMASGHSIWLAKNRTHSDPYNYLESKAIVRHMRFTADGFHLVSAADDKILRVWSVDATKLTLQIVSSRPIPKRVGVLSALGDSILFADKFGDVYQLPLLAPGQFYQDDQPQRPPSQDHLEKTSEYDNSAFRNPILGHSSLVTSVVMSPDNRFIITADRDEHIRVSRYPDGHIIDKFIFGCRSFVSALCLVPSKDILIAGGGDSDLKLFSWKTGALKLKINLLSVMQPHLLQSSVKEKKRQVKGGKLGDISAKSEDDRVTSAVPGDLAVSNIIPLSNKGGKTQILVTSYGSRAIFAFALEEDHSGNISHESTELLVAPAPIIACALRGDSDLVISLDLNHSCVQGNLDPIWSVSYNDKSLTLSSLQEFSGFERPAMTDASRKELDLYEYLVLLAKEVEGGPVDAAEDSNNLSGHHESKKATMRNRAAALREKLRDEAIQQS